MPDHSDSFWLEVTEAGEYSPNAARLLCSFQHHDHLSVVTHMVERIENSVNVLAVHYFDEPEGERRRSAYRSILI